jgi:L-seryl-tRNA(Ser) seleniumtransferase
VLLHDAGSGVIELPEAIGSAREPALGRVLADGADIVTASGDKMLGGPQAGIIAGRRDLVDRLRRHPLTRAIRPCKLTMGLLHHLLALYRDGRAAEIPVYAMLSQPPETIRGRARKLARRLRAVVPRDRWTIETRPENCRVGGGALPGVELETWVVSLRHRTLGANEVERRLRGAEVPVVARIARDDVVIDLRTLVDPDLAAVESAVRSVDEG